jgi:hypothetical protein
MMAERHISILGVKTELVIIQRNRLKGLNADLLLGFDYYGNAGVI